MTLALILVAVLITVAVFAAAGGLDRTGRRRRVGTRRVERVVERPVTRERIVEQPVTRERIIED